MASQHPTTALRAYVGGVGVEATELELYAAFVLVGVQLAHVELVVNRATGCRRGFAFVAIAEPAAGLPCMNVDAVLARMRLALIDDRPITVQRILRRLGGPIQAGGAAICH
jgi:RNA recognition motif-containing protein